MTFRVARPVQRAWLNLTTTSSTARRTFSSDLRLAGSAKRSTSFTVLTDRPKSFHEDIKQLLSSAEGRLQNPGDHNAAVVLATPDFVHLFQDKSFLETLTQELSGGSQQHDFNLLYAIVDHVAPPLGSFVTSPGLSVLRGRRGDLLSSGGASAPRQKRNDDAVSGIDFLMGSLTVTMPLARTTFLNYRTSTLIQNTFLAANGSFQSSGASYIDFAGITLPESQSCQSMADLSVAAPLLPVTRRRVVSESFGNIVRAVQSDGERLPASAELESAVDKIFEHKPPSAEASGPMGIWAVVTPPSCLVDELPSEHLKWMETASIDLDQAISEKASEYLTQVHKEGGRAFKILSGGGGWGAKKGLLSLDPDQTHFSLSDEEELDKFSRALDGSGFVPVGSGIQFFKSMDVDSKTSQCPPAASPVFGVPGAVVDGATTRYPEVIWDHFGALSNEGVYIAGPSRSIIAGANSSSKVDVPHARITTGSE